MILLDTETTDLLLPSTAELKLQPRLIELCVFVLDDDSYETLGEHVYLLNPGITIPPAVTKIHGISDADVKGCPTFDDVLPDLVEIFFAERRMLAHNLPFDRGVLEVELRRLDAVSRFPWPPDQTCTVALSEHLYGRQLKLTELSEKILQKEYKQTHRAKDDVTVLAEIVRKMRW